MTTGKKYEYISLDYINELADGDDDFLKDIIDTFLTTVPQNIDNLTQAVANKDYEVIYFNAHKLKGSFDFIGSTRLREAFTLMEQYAEEKADIDPIKNMLNEVLSLSAKVITELKEVLPQ